MQETVTRSEIPTEQTWDLRDLFADQQAWETEVEAIPAVLEQVKAYKGKIAESAEMLLGVLKESDKLQERFTKVLTYAHLSESADGSDPLNQANAARAASLQAKVSAETSFIKSEILQLSDQHIAECIVVEPELAEFQKQLDDLLETQPYRLSPEAENVLAAFTEVHQAPFMIYERSKSSDLHFPSFTTSAGTEYPLTFNTFANYETSADTEVRRKAYKTFYEALANYQNTYAAALATEIKKEVVESRLRGYDSVTDMLLHKQDVTQDMYHRQLDTIQEELAPHMRRFAKLKQRVLGLEEMTYADLKAPIDPDNSPAMTYDEAGELVLEALKPMGDEYMDFMKQGVHNRWVDYANNHGKRSGAFCSSPYGVHPYILVTWNNSMQDAFTLAHELGHAGHFSLAGRYQRISNTRPSMYFIEAPSTMNEMLLSQHILSKYDDPAMRRWVILQSLGTYYHNFVTHILEGELQRRIYKKADEDVPITTDILNGEKKALLEDFWGDAVTIDDDAGLTWMRQPHYYMGLYPYTYSAGLTASTAAAQKFKTEGQPAIDRWLETLKAGGTLKPQELMQKAGVDMTTKEPIQEAVAYVGSLVDELERSF
ncbi:oligoendopeptidase F [Salisediminibacterium halotolerans]|uniref:oligoendopeptidase F n=1 Tax=Salisediminibacterium halotolerans TaxID=517425 RepID=UPI000EABF268|nr:oligoendopeptidase F [Salisediminibacterium halotolerans]RLJ73160.1 oligoendopeptidase F [Actinophytocola xinjiangensis]RPE86582.1 oligoendopeptidase F [Salisediminibacterium halotolerans]TWG33957.1 oligoendopeptidase F [Salisediminibacterium halotolerans]GEL06634.1 oligoendopeptidase F [Salisediminibacterium halotolerans]